MLTSRKGGEAFVGSRSLSSLASAGAEARGGLILEKSLSKIKNQLPHAVILRVFILIWDKPLTDPQFACYSGVCVFL